MYKRQVRRIDDKGVTDLFQVGKSVQIGDFFSVCRSDGQAAFDFGNLKLLLSLQVSPV